MSPFCSLLQDGPLVARVSWRTLASCLCTWSALLPLPPVGLCPPAPLDALGFPEDSGMQDCDQEAAGSRKCRLGSQAALESAWTWWFTAVQVRSEVYLWRRGSLFSWGSELMHKSPVHPIRSQADDSAGGWEAIRSCGARVKVGMYDRS